jgi:hypothetical protein
MIHVGRHADLQRAIPIGDVDLHRVHEIGAFVARLHGRRRELRFDANPTHDPGSVSSVPCLGRREPALPDRASPPPTVLGDVSVEGSAFEIRDAIEWLTGLMILPARGTSRAPVPASGLAIWRLVDAVADLLRHVLWTP